MFRNHVAVMEVSRYTGQFAEKPPVRGMKYALALVRHFLSQYRENLRPASAISVVRKARANRHSRRQAMLASAKMVGFIPTRDYDKARAFYESKLGFKFVSLDQFALVMNVGGHMIRIAKVPNFTPLQGTILGWQVENIESAAAWLRDRGVPPEKSANMSPDKFECTARLTAKSGLHRWRGRFTLNFQCKRHPKSRPCDLAARF
jgi:hypothetical protein